MTCSGNYTGTSCENDYTFSIQLMRHTLALLSMAQSLATPLQFYTATSKAFSLLSTFSQEQYRNVPNMAEQISLLCSIHAQLSTQKRRGGGGGGGVASRILS